MFDAAREFWPHIVSIVSQVSTDSIGKCDESICRPHISSTMSWQLGISLAHVCQDLEEVAETDASSRRRIFPEVVLGIAPAATTLTACTIMPSSAFTLRRI